MHFLQLATESLLKVGAAVNSVSWVAGGIQSSYVRKPHPPQASNTKNYYVRPSDTGLSSSDFGDRERKIQVQDHFE